MNIFLFTKTFLSLKDNFISRNYSFGFYEFDTLSTLFFIPKQDSFYKLSFFDIDFFQRRFRIHKRMFNYSDYSFKKILEMIL